MDDEKNKGKTTNDEVSIVIPTKAALVVLSMLGIGAGGYSTVEVAKLKHIPDARPDSWTKTEALNQSAELRKEIRDAQVIQEALIRAIEVRINELEQNKVLIIERLDNLLSVVHQLRNAQVLRHKTHPGPEGGRGSWPGPMSSEG